MHPLVRTQHTQLSWHTQNISRHTQHTSRRTQHTYRGTHNAHRGTHNTHRSTHNIRHMFEHLKILEARNMYACMAVCVRTYVYTHVHMFRCAVRACGVCVCACCGHGALCAMAGNLMSAARPFMQHDTICNRKSYRVAVKFQTTSIRFKFDDPPQTGSTYGPDELFIRSFRVLCLKE